MMGRDSDSDSSYKKRRRRQRSRSRSGSRHRSSRKRKRYQRSRSPSTPPRDASRSYDRRARRRRSRSSSRGRSRRGRRHGSNERSRSSSASSQRKTARPAAKSSSNQPATFGATEDTTRKGPEADALSAEEAAARQRQIETIESGAFTAAPFRSGTGITKARPKNPAEARGVFEEMRVEKEHLDAIFGRPGAAPGGVGAGVSGVGGKSEQSAGVDLVELILRKGDLFSQALHKDSGEAWAKWRKKAQLWRRRSESAL